MLKNLLKTKTGLLIVALVILIVLLIVIQLIVKRSPTEQINRGGVVGAFLIKDNSLGGQPLNVIDDFTVTFNKPISLSDLKFDLTPHSDVTFMVDNLGSTLKVTPSKIWSFDTTYQLVIQKGTKAVDGSELTTDYNVTFKTVPYSGI